MGFTGRVVKATFGRHKESLETRIASVVNRGLQVLELDVEVSNPGRRSARSGGEERDSAKEGEASRGSKEARGSEGSSGSKSSSGSSESQTSHLSEETSATDGSARRRGPGAHDEAEPTVDPDAKVDAESRGGEDEGDVWDGEYTRPTTRESMLSTVGGVASTFSGITATVGGITSTVAGVASTVGSVADSASGSARAVPGVGGFFGDTLGIVSNASTAVGERVASVGKVASAVGGVGSLIGSSLGRAPERQRKALPAGPRVIRRRPLARPRSTLDMMRKNERRRPRSYADLEARQVAGIEPHEIFMKVASYQLGQMLLSVLQRSAQAQLNACNAAKRKLTERQIMLLSRLPMAMLERILPPQLALPPAAEEAKKRKEEAARRGGRGRSAGAAPKGSPRASAGESARRDAPAGGSFSY